jgi:uncharacterized membrane protein (DUF2068 family)
MARQWQDEPLTQGVWDVNTLSWVKMTQPIIDAGNVTVSGGALSVTKTPLTATAPTAASVGVTSAQVVAVNAARKSLVITNLSTNLVSIGIGAAAVLNSGITLAPYGTWTMNEWTFSTAVINAIASGASSAIAIQEFT